MEGDWVGERELSDNCVLKRLFELKSINVDHRALQIV